MSTMRHVTVPLPYRMETDAPTVNAPAGSSPFLYNVVPGNPAVLRKRGSTTRIAEIEANPGVVTHVGMWPGDPLWPLRVSVSRVRLSSITAPGPQFRMSADGAATWATTAARFTTVEPSTATVNNGATTSGAFRVGKSVPFAGLMFTPVVTDAVTALGVWGGAPLSAASVTTSTCNLTLGSRTVTTISPSITANVYAGYIFMVGTAFGAVPYRVVSNTATTLTLDRPWGDGIVGEVSVAGVGFFLHAETSLAGLPITTAGGRIGSSSAAVFRGRLWTVGSPAASLSPHSWPFVLRWSLPGVPQFPSQNYTTISTREQLTGCAGLPNALLLWSRTSMWRLTGFDESSFQIDHISNSVGCIDAGSISYYNDRAYWCGEDGVYSSNGYDLREHTQYGAGSGIRNLYRYMLREMESAPSGSTAGAGWHNRIVRTAAHDGYLWVMITGLDTSKATLPALVMDIGSGSWAHFGHGSWASSNTNNVLRAAAASDGQLYTASLTQIRDASACMTRPQQLNAAFDLDGATPVPIQAAARFQVVNPAGPDTARVLGVQVAHNCLVQPAETYVAWRVGIEHDSNHIEASTDTYPVTIDAGDIPHRTYTAIPSGTAMPMISVENYFVERLRDTVFPVEGATFRVTMVSDGAPANVSLSDVLSVSLLIDGQTTQLGRVQD